MTRAKIVLAIVIAALVLLGNASLILAQSESSAPAAQSSETSTEPQLREEPAAGPSAYREVWLVSARTNGACEDTPQLAYWRYEAGQWVRSNLDEFTAGAPLTTCVWTHGNWVSHDRAAIMGWEVYEQFKRCCHDRAFRLVIWSWPTDRQGKVRQDARNKAVRAEQFAYPLAWLVNQLPAGSPVSLLGFSYGAKLDAGALHLLGGGDYCGRYLDTTGHDPRPARGIFLAAAMDNFALAQDAQYNFALPYSQRIINFYNARDGVLDFYPLLWRWGGPKAAGRTGLIGYGGPFAEKVREMNVASMIGPKHEWDRYIFTPSVMSRIVNEALFVDVTAEHIGPAESDVVESNAAEFTTPDISLAPVQADAAQPTSQEDEGTGPHASSGPVLAPGL